MSDSSAYVLVPHRRPFGERAVTVVLGLVACVCFAAPVHPETRQSVVIRGHNLPVWIREHPPR